MSYSNKICIICGKEFTPKMANRNVVARHVVKSTANSKQQKEMHYIIRSIKISMQNTIKSTTRPIKIRS